MPMDLYSNRNAVLCAVSGLGFIGTYVMTRLFGVYRYPWMIISLLHYTLLIGHCEVSFDSLACNADFRF